ncbi:MAG: hypothetical protein OXG08_04225 [Gammaproteobacteria bacterium]|nr:hypothetical protein [Gammaproteobacteria bacterium]
MSQAHFFLQAEEQEDGSDTHSFLPAVMRHQKLADFVPLGSPIGAFSWRFWRKKEAIARTGEIHEANAPVAHHKSRGSGRRIALDAEWSLPLPASGVFPPTFFNRSGSGQKFHPKKASSGPECIFPW